MKAVVARQPCSKGGRLPHHPCLRLGQRIDNLDETHLPQGAGDSVVGHVVLIVCVSATLERYSLPF